MLHWDSKHLNPSAKEFVPASAPASSSRRPLSAAAPEFFPCRGLLRSPIGSHVAHAQPPRAQSQSQSSRAASENSSRSDSQNAAAAARAQKIKRTVFVRDIDPRITEEELVRAFSDCGVVKACRICGDTQSGLHYGFVEFEHADGARAAMDRDCTRIGLYPVRVLASHTTIDPRGRLSPPSADEQGKTARTAYCSFIDKMLTVKDLKEFFESQCGEVSHLRLLDNHRSTTRYAFIEFVKEEFAMAAIKCTGMLLGHFRLKVVSSKAPIRPRQQ